MRKHDLDDKETTDQNDGENPAQPVEMPVDEFLGGLTVFEDDDGFQKKTKSPAQGGEQHEREEIKMKSARADSEYFVGDGSEPGE